MRWLGRCILYSVFTFYWFFRADGLFAPSSFDARKHATLGAHPQFGGEMSELDDGGTYFDGRVVRVPKNGTYNYMSSRNNNFSNRGQKGWLIVT